MPLRIAGKTTPKPTAPHPAENMFVEDLTSVPEQAHWNCVRKGKIHVLEIFAGSARFSQCCALSGLKVGTPVDIRDGGHVLPRVGQQVDLRARVVVPKSHERSHEFREGARHGDVVLRHARRHRGLLRVHRGVAEHEHRIRCNDIQGTTHGHGDHQGTST